jgi:NAD-dependent dihydropyrimidine dehydrogenase PreA subunit
MNLILPEIKMDACDGCGDCLLACETGALGLADDKVVLARPEQCQYDGNCEPVCPAGAISLPYAVVLSLQG